MTWLLILASILATGEVGLHETLSGSLTGADLVVTTDGGVSCRGHLTELAPGSGRGILVCSDHRSGYFIYHSQGGAGRADGRLGDDPLTLFFG